MIWQSLILLTPILLFGGINMKGAKISGPLHLSGETFLQETTITGDVHVKGKAKILGSTVTGNATFDDSLTAIDTKFEKNLYLSANKNTLKKIEAHEIHIKDAGHLVLESCKVFGDVILEGSASFTASEDSLIKGKVVQNSAAQEQSARKSSLR